MHTATYRQPAPPRHLAPAQVNRLTAAGAIDQRVAIALDTFPEWPDRRTMHGLSDAEYWAVKASEHITTLAAAHELHKQITSGRTVPRALSYALNAMQVEVGNRIKTAIRRHVSNGGQLEAELRQAWRDAA